MLWYSHELVDQLMDIQLQPENVAPEKHTLKAKYYMHERGTLKQVLWSPAVPLKTS